MNQKRVIVVVNKYWECDPVCWVLTNKYINEQCGINLPFNQQNLKNYPSYGPAKDEPTSPRIIYTTDNHQIEVWCVSDLLSHSAPNQQSSSEEKMKVLPRVFNYSPNPIDLVVAVGTASTGPSEAINPVFKSRNINGSVVVGSQVYMYNGYTEGSHSNYQCDHWEQTMRSTPTPYIEALQNLPWPTYSQLFMQPPNNPSPNNQAVYISPDFVALGDVNVTDYKLYTTKDMETGDSFLAHNTNSPNGVSLETTHCLIYLAARQHLNDTPPPFMFISGITDRYTKFDQDVSPKVYAQNVSCAQNAGVAVAALLAFIANTPQANQESTNKQQHLSDAVH